MTSTIDPQTLSGNWNYPTPIRFGPGRIRELAQTCREFGIERPLLVTDPGLAAMPMVTDTAQSCRDASLACEVFSDVRGNPVESNVTEGVRAWRDGGHDGVIGFGGGSALDAAKAVALMSGQTRPMWDFEDREDWWTRADAGGIAPVVAVPTTSGTGSEVGRASVITDVRDHTKKIIFHPKMLPVAVIADPELTVGRIGRTTRRLTLFWGYRQVRYRCESRQIAAEVTQLRAGNHEGMSGKRCGPWYRVRWARGRGTERARCASGTSGAARRAMPNRQDCRFAQPEAAPKGCGTRMCRMKFIGSSTT